MVPDLSPARVPEAFQQERRGGLVEERRRFRRGMGRARYVSHKKGTKDDLPTGWVERVWESSDWWLGKYQFNRHLDKSQLPFLVEFPQQARIIEDVLSLPILSHVSGGVVQRLARERPAA